MFEGHAVLSKFKKLVNEHVEITERMIDYDKTESNRREILGWLLELHLIRENMKKDLEKKGIGIILENPI